MIIGEFYDKRSADRPQHRAKTSQAGPARLRDVFAGKRQPRAAKRGALPSIAGQR